jgi:hypothetical protein
MRLFQQYDRRFMPASLMQSVQLVLRCVEHFDCIYELVDESSAAQHREESNQLFTHRGPHELHSSTLATTFLCLRKLGESPAARSDWIGCEQRTRYSRKSSGRNESCLTTISEDALRSRGRSSVARHLRKSAHCSHQILSFDGIECLWLKNGTTQIAK